MAVLTYLNWVSGTTVDTPGFYDFSLFETPNIGAQGYITHFGNDTAVILLFPGGDPYRPVDAIALLGTTLDVYSADEIGLLVMSGLTPIIDQPLAPIEGDWPIGKPRNFVWRVPRDADGLPQWVDLIAIYVKFSGTRFFGGASVGPGFHFGPTTALEYSWDDAPAKMARSDDGCGWPAEYPPRRTLTVGCENVSFDSIYRDLQYTPFLGGLPPPVTLELQRNLQTMLAQYLPRGARVLLLPVEEPTLAIAGSYVSRCAEYGRLASDPTVRHLAGKKMALAFQFCED